MEVTINNNNSEKEYYKIVTWAANTTGKQINDEICELAGCSDLDANVTFSEYIMPYCDINKKHSEKHGLKEMNGRRVRFLMDCHEKKVIHTKTEIYALGDFLNWLEKIKAQSAGIILVCYEPNDYISQILLESLHRYGLNKRFLKIVKFFINCFDICKDKYGNQVKYCSLKNVTYMLFNENIEFKRALSRAKGCHRIITDIDNESSSDDFIEPYIKNIGLPNIVSKHQLQSKDQTVEIVPVKERKILNSRKVSFQLNNQPVTETFQTNEVNTFNKLKVYEEKPNHSPATNSLNKIIGWAVNITGRKYKDEILQVTAFTPDSIFSQYIMPKKHIYAYKYSHKIGIIKQDGIKQLIDLQTQRNLEAKSEALILENFIRWLEQIKGDDDEGLIILYHDDKKYSSLAILLESLRRCKLTEAFCNVVEGFVNTYSVSEDKCIHLTKCFTLKNLSELLLKKKIEVGNAMIRAKVCYEIIEHLAQVKTGGLVKKNADILNLIQPFVNTISNEEKEFAQLKIKLNEKKKINY